MATSRTRRPALTSVGAFEAKTHFSKLLQRVAKGEEITITKHDMPVAKLVPADRPFRERAAQIFRQIDALRESLPKGPTNVSLKELIKEGRKF